MSSAVPSDPRPWWDELDTGDGPAVLRVRAVGDHVRLVVEVGGGRADVHLPAATASALGQALVAAAGGDAPPIGEAAPGAVERAVGAGPPLGPRPWSAGPPGPDERAQAVEAALVALRRLCSVLPETVEVDTLGDPSFRVATRMFAVVETVEEVPVVRFKASAEEQQALVTDARFRPDPETGHRGWTALRLDAVAGDHELEQVVLASYRLVAPPDLAAQLDAALAAGDDA